MQAEANSEVAYYEPPEKKTQVNVRMPVRMKQRLARLARAWKLYAEVLGNEADDARSIDVSHVMLRLLASALDGAETELAENGPLPESDEDWTAFEQAVRRALKKK